MSSSDAYDERLNDERLNDERLNDERRDDERSIDALLSEMLDADNSDAAQCASAALKPDDARRWADMHFLHTLLQEVHRSSADENASRVTQAMAGIDSREFEAPRELTVVANEPRPAASALAPISRRKWLVSSSAAAAAGLAGGAAWLWSTGSARVARAAVQRIARDARIPNDRQYRVTTAVNHAHGEQRRFESQLFVRGGEKFALCHPGLLGEVWVGSNGSQGWFVPAIGPVIITDEPRYPARWAREEGVALPDLQLAGLLDLMAERFKLSLLPNEPLPTRPELPCQRISGWCDARDGGPSQIELWAHPVTGVAERLVLVWLRSPNEAGLTRIELDLLAEAPLADAWYEAQTHRAEHPIFPKLPPLSVGSSP